MFNILKLSDKIRNVVLDIRNFEDISEVILDEKPDFVFHLAAQAIVSTSYTNPLETISSNTMGTTNILEALRVSNHKCTAVIITSDKLMIRLDIKKMIKWEAKIFTVVLKERQN